MGKQPGTWIPVAKWRLKVYQGDGGQTSVLDSGRLLPNPLFLLLAYGLDKRLHLPEPQVPSVQNETKYRILLPGVPSGCGGMMCVGS